MHFTISNSHIFNCSGTRLYPQGHSTNNFSSLTIQIVAYLLNKYWGLPPLPGISPNRPRASARTYLIHHEFFVACTVAQGPWAGVFRKGGRPGERAPSNSSHHCSHVLLLVHKFLYQLHRKRNTMCSRVLLLQGNYSREKFWREKMECIHFKHLF